MQAYHVVAWHQLMLLVPEYVAYDPFYRVARHCPWRQSFRYDHSQARVLRWQCACVCSGRVQHEQSPSGDTPAFQGINVFRGAVQARRRRECGTHCQSWPGPFNRANHADAYTARRLRPLARRALITARPPRVFMRTKKPWVRLRRVTEGWKVRFIGDPNIKELTRRTPRVGAYYVLKF